jgi:hypothetical protein
MASCPTFKFWDLPRTGGDRTLVFELNTAVAVSGSSPKTQRASTPVLSKTVQAVLAGQKAKLLENDVVELFQWRP